MIDTPIKIKDMMSFFMFAQQHFLCLHNNISKNLLWCNVVDLNIFKNNDNDYGLNNSWDMDTTCTKSAL